MPASSTVQRFTHPAENPARRGLVELNAGRLDGVAMRVDAFFTQTPFVREVDVPLLTLNVYAFSRPPCPTR